MAEERFARELADFNVRYQTMEKDLEISRLQAQHARTLIITLAVGVILLLLLLGLWFWLRQRRLRREAQMRIDTLEHERRRIACELHDGLCNDLLALEMQCASQLSPAEATLRLSQLRQRARSLSHQLMPPEFSHLSLSDLLAHLAQQVSADGSVAATFTSPMQATPALSASLSHELYRLVQEHTANIVKGGTAKHIDIVLDSPDASHLRLSVTDDGQQSSAEATGIGQRTMADRALSIGAHVSTAPSDDGRNRLELLFTP